MLLLAVLLATADKLIASRFLLPQASPQMPLMRASSKRFRRSIAALLLGAIALTAGLASSPQWHDWLHEAGDRTNHECAATLLSSGSLEHSDCAPAVVAPEPTPGVSAFRTQIFARVLAYLAFTRLEHAPPVVS